MIDYILRLITTSMEKPEEVYENIIPILGFLVAVILMPVTYVLLLLFETFVLHAELSIPYQLLFFFVVLAIGLLIDYIVCLSKHAKASAYLNIKKIAQSATSNILDISDLTFEEAQEFIDSLSKGKDGKDQ